MIFNKNKGFLRKEIFITRNKKRIWGELYLPEEYDLKEEIPLVIYSHVLGSNHSTGEKYIKYFLDKNMGIFLFDFMGGGKYSKSDGKTTEMSVLTEVDDLNSVVNHFKQTNQINLSKIILIGESQGGLVTALLSVKVQNDIEGVILNYPAFNIRDDVHHSFKSKDDVPDEFFYHNWIFIGPKYVSDIWDVDSYEIIKQFDKKVLINHGDRDYLVPLEYSIKANETYKNSKLNIIEGGGHGFSGKQLKEALKHIDEYLEEIL